MDILRRLLKKFREMDKKKRSYLIAIICVAGVMIWAFVTAGIITSNFNRAQLKGTENEKTVKNILRYTEKKEITATKKAWLSFIML